MTVTEILEQAKALSPEERKELAKHLIDMIDTVPSRKPKTGAEIAKYLRNTPPIELVDSHIEDPVEWVKAQRQKRQEYLESFMDDEA